MGRGSIFRQLLVLIALGVILTGSCLRADEVATVSTPMTSDQVAVIWPLLQAETQRLQSSIPWLKLVLLDTRNPTYRAFMADGVLKVSNAELVNMEQGMSSVVVPQSQVNGQTSAVCYILFDADHASYLYHSMFLSLQAASDNHSAAAFLVGHETGHCLDRLERQQKLAQNMVWNSADLAPLGISSIAAERVFGKQMATAAYFSQIRRLTADAAQSQYEERVADAFGVLWVWRLGGAECLRDVLATLRSHQSPWEAHFTTPTLMQLDQEKEALAQTQSVAQIWALAREAQLATGVDPSVGLGSVHTTNPLLDTLPEAPPPAPVRPEDLVPKSRNFNELPRFGEP